MGKQTAQHPLWPGVSGRVKKGGLDRVAVEIVPEEARLDFVYQRLLRGVLP